MGTFDNGKTIAIIACGFNYLFESNSIKIVKEIFKNNGTIISEYFPDTPPQAFTFLRRNRLIATISNATVVIEAPIKSGSLNTAQTALKYNKKVFAIPWNINCIRGEGCNFLIQNKASLLTNYKQILMYLNISTKTTPNNNLNINNIHKINISTDFKELYNYISKNEPASKALIYSTFCKYNIADLNSKLLLMELEELIVLKR